MTNNITYALVAAAAIMIIPACGNHSGHSHDEHDHDVHEQIGHSHENEESGSESAFGEIVLSPEMAEASGVRVNTVEPGPFRSAIHTSGRILPSGGSEAVVTARNSGILSYDGRQPAPGQQVSKGQGIAHVSSASMAEGDQVTRARIEYETALKEYERSKQLVADNLISEKDFNTVESAYLTARNAYEGIAAGQSGSRGVAVTAPISGYVKSVLKNEGEYVQAGEAVAVVTQDRKLRMQADLPERYASQRNSISGANFRLADGNHSHSLDELGGRLLSVAHSIENEAAFLHVTFEFDNCGDIVPGSYAEIWLLTGTRENVISVPESALTEEQGEFFVYVRLDEECYTRVPVKLGGRNGEFVEIAEGLEGGEDLVVEGAYQVKLASAAVVPEAHNHSH